jgi:hypothetical protein
MGLGMFFAFWFCEYLKVHQAEQGQTKILKMRNIQFFKDGAILPHSHPDLKFADCVSLTFEPQKQQDKKNSVTQEATSNSVLWPIRFAAGIIRWIGSYPGTSSNTNVSAYMSNSSVKHVTSQQVINALRNAVGAIGKARLGISKDKIGTHSIRLGAAMAMYLGECPVYAIMLIRQWSSNAFLLYIRKQVMEFSHNVSKRMLTFQNYCHIPNFKHQVSANDPQVRNDPDNAKMRRNVGGDTSRCMQLQAFSQFN